MLCTLSLVGAALHMPPAGAQLGAVAQRALAAAAAAAAISLSPLAPTFAADVSLNLLLNEFGDKSQVESGLRQAGISAKDSRMIKLWATLKEARLVEAGAEAADLVQLSNSADGLAVAQQLASAQTQVRQLQPYLDELQTDLTRGRWKFVGGYLGVIFSQRPAIQTVILNSYPGDESMMVSAHCMQGCSCQS